MCFLNQKKLQTGNDTHLKIAFTGSYQTTQVHMLFFVGLPPLAPTNGMMVVKVFFWGF